MLLYKLFTVGWKQHYILTDNFTDLKPMVSEINKLDFLLSVPRHGVDPPIDFTDITTWIEDAEKVFTNRQAILVYLLDQHKDLLKETAELFAESKKDPDFDPETN